MADEPWLDRIPKWAKIIGGLVVLATFARGAVANVETGLSVLDGWAPLQTQVRQLKGDYEGHVVEFVKHSDGHNTEHEEIHEIQHQLQNAETRDEARYDTTRILLDWMVCQELRRQDEVDGRTPRACRPFGGSP